MPIWLRNYNLKKLQEAIKRENEANQGKTTNTSSAQENIPPEVKQMMANKLSANIKGKIPSSVTNTIANKTGIPIKS